MYESSDIIDFHELFNVGNAEVPFEKELQLVGVNGKLVRIRAIFDDGAMVNVIDAGIFASLKDHLSTCRTSRRVLRMANGTLVASEGSWTGTVVVKGVRAVGTFEIFPSNGAWAALFGKPLLKAFSASHEYTKDTITLNNNGQQSVIENDLALRRKELGAEWLRKSKVAIASISNLGDHFGDSPLRHRQVPIIKSIRTSEQCLEPIQEEIEPMMLPNNASGLSGLESIHPDVFRYSIGIKGRKRKAARRRRKERKQRAKVLLMKWKQVQEKGRTVYEKRAEHLRVTRQRLEKNALERWENSPYDFGLAEGLQNTKAAVAPASSPGAPSVGAPMKQRQVNSSAPKEHSYSRDSQDVEHSILAVEEAALDDASPGNEQPEIAVGADTSLFTRTTMPFKPARVTEILRLIQIGDDVSVEERATVQQLVEEFADIFALSVHEVKHIPGAEHRLDVPEEAQLRTKIGQKPMTPPQAAYFSKALDIMLEAGVCARIAAKDVKCVSPITLAEKAHTEKGLTIDELRQKVNLECETIGVPSPFVAPPNATPLDTRNLEGTMQPQKWRVCTNYRELNKVTQVLPMPQGNIRPKQQALCGHRWVSIFDFAAGFYAVEIAEESRPYTAFYVPGRGYFVYCRMPFGLTGAPSCFNEVTGRALHGLVDTMIQLFVDDGAMAGDVFVDKLANLRIFFTRCREESLSLSPQKTQLFMSEVVFAGERVGSEGIKPDLSKLTAVVNWSTPSTIQNLGSFLGLTGYFRPLIKNYSLLEKPLKDLLNTLEVPKSGGKRAYQNAARAHRLEGQWTPEHAKAFVVLKTALTSSPVLKGPKYDGSSFTVTTDGCKDGFAGVLTQRFQWTSSRGTVHSRTHPIAFASKRTSDSESRYKPYLLEFAALKFSLDKFSDTIAGYPVEVETDCLALRDTISNNKLGATHARWLDGIMGHNIVDVRHRPGRLNQAADGISRQFTDMPAEKGDGHEWTVDPSWTINAGLAYDVWSAHVDDSISQLRVRFSKEPVFAEVIDAMHNLDHGQTVRDKMRARHRMLGYQIEGGKLWRIGDGKSTRARARLECVTQEEAKELARIEHETNGHFGRDLIKIALLDRVCSPKLDKSILAAIVECGRCKAFGGQHLASLLEPITRRHPWELLVGDYLSMPMGKGGFHTIGLYMDVYSQKIFGHKFTTYGTMATTIASLDKIRRTYRMPEVFMADGGSHFAGHDVAEWCLQHGSRYEQVAAYSPWVNGLLEGTNGKLLSRLKRLCAPNLGEDEYMKMSSFEHLPQNWPLHFDTAIEQLNRRILPAYKFSPDELCLGTVVNTTETPLAVSSAELAEASIRIQNQYVAQQHLDAYSHIVEHAAKRKAAFDRKVELSRDGVIEYGKGDLVQIRDSKLDLTLSTEAKLLPRWGAPHRVVDQRRNSYRLETAQGLPIGGMFSARRLRRFVPRPGTELARQQLEVESKRVGKPDEPMEGLDFEEEGADQEDGDVEEVVLS